MRVNDAMLNDSLKIFIIKDSRLERARTTPKKKNARGWSKRDKEPKLVSEAEQFRKLIEQFACSKVKVKSASGSMFIFFFFFFSTFSLLEC